MNDARPLLRDLIHIPDRVHANDFVLKLSEGVTEAAADGDDQELRRHHPARKRVQRGARLNPRQRRKRPQRSLLPRRLVRLGQVALHGRPGSAAGRERESAQQA